MISCLHLFAHADNSFIHTYTRTQTHVLDIGRQNQPSLSSWNRAGEEETNFWGYGTGTEQRRASRGWTSHDERASNSGRDSLDDSWFTNDRPAPHREHLGAKNSLDDQGYE